MHSLLRHLGGREICEFFSVMDEFFPEHTVTIRQISGHRAAFDHCKICIKVLPGIVSLPLKALSPVNSCNNMPCLDYLFPGSLQIRA